MTCRAAARAKGLPHVGNAIGTSAGAKTIARAAAAETTGVAKEARLLRAGSLPEAARTMNTGQGSNGGACRGGRARPRRGSIAIAGPWRWITPPLPLEATLGAGEHPRAPSSNQTCFPPFPEVLSREPKLHATGGCHIQAVRGRSVHLGLSWAAPDLITAPRPALLRILARQPTMMWDGSVCTSYTRGC